MSKQLERVGIQTN